MDRPVEGISWKEFQYYADIVIAQIRKVEYRPDYIMGIQRGGLPLAVYLSNMFDVPLIHDNEQGIVGKKILICDDISDTGKTLKEWIEKYSLLNEVRIATLCYRWGSKVAPHFYGRVLRESEHNPHYRWIKFPWEK